jgi:hypothetical protein
MPRNIGLTVVIRTVLCVETQEKYGVKKQYRRKEVSSETELTVEEYANSMVVGVDYSFQTPTNDTQSVHIKFLKGKYADTTIRYGKIKIEEKDDAAHLQFAFDVIECKDTKPKKLQKDSDFIKYVGDFLVHLLAMKIEDNDEVGTNDTEKPGV